MTTRNVARVLALSFFHCYALFCLLKTFLIDPRRGFYASSRVKSKGKLTMPQTDVTWSSTIQSQQLASSCSRNNKQQQRLSVP